MSPETAYFLEKSQKLLAEAVAILNIGLNSAAGRTAYLAGFHAAQALISETTGKTIKTHRGVHGEFHKLIKDNNNFDPDMRVFLSKSYNLKAIADYETGPDAEVSSDRASSAVAGATRFIEQIEQALKESTSPQS